MFVTYFLVAVSWWWGNESTMQLSKEIVKWYKAEKDDRMASVLYRVIGI
jgi:hypothetical protein